MLNDFWKGRNLGPVLLSRLQVLRLDKERVGLILWLNPDSFSPLYLLVLLEKSNLGHNNYLRGPILKSWES